MADAKPIRVLVVDDDNVSRLVAAAFLRQAGVTVTEVGDAAAALNSLDREPFDVLVLDYHMPGVSGATLARMIREREAPLGRRTPLLGLSADAGDAARANCLAAGMDDFLTKPIMNDALIAAVERLARDRRQRAQGTPVR